MLHWAKQPIQCDVRNGVLPFTWDATTIPPQLWAIQAAAPLHLFYIHACIHMIPHKCKYSHILVREKENKRKRARGKKNDTYLGVSAYTLIYLSIYLSIYIFIYLSICLFIVFISICPQYVIMYLHARVRNDYVHFCWKRSYTCITSVWNTIQYVWARKKEKEM